MQPLSPEHAHTEANLLTQRGISLLSQGDEAALKQAQDCFEKAIAQRASLPLNDNPIYRWGLTAGWMNRGEALTRLGGAHRLKEALKSYDIAIAHLHRLPLEGDPIYRWRLCVAWMNRGITEQSHDGPMSAQKALLCFDNAVSVMQGHADSARLDYQQVQASVWMNRANALLNLTPPQWETAADSARRALKHSRLGETHDSVCTEAGIKARHALCRVLVHLLESPAPPATQAEAWIIEATDAVEEVMSLSIHTPAHLRLREEIFHFGCRIYRAFQPHFLAEFLTDSSQESLISAAMWEAAQEALTQAAAQLQAERLAGYTPQRLERLLQTLQALSEAAEKMRFLSHQPSEE
jgi:tetratricopeptide (TPR) repeat protein